ATSVSVIAGRSCEKAVITGSPRASDWTKSGSSRALPASLASPAVCIVVTLQNPLDRGFELSDRAHLEHVGAVRPVLVDRRVVGAPVAARLGVQPEHRPAPTRQLAEHRRHRLTVVR